VRSGGRHQKWNHDDARGARRDQLLDARLPTCRLRLWPHEERDGDGALPVYLGDGLPDGRIPGGVRTVRDDEESGLGVYGLGEGQQDNERQGRKDR
jgi:hypothetical protein